MNKIAPDALRLVPASGYGCKGETFEQAATNAAAVLFLTGVLSAFVFLFWHAPETL